MGEPAVIYNSKTPSSLSPNNTTVLNSADGFNSYSRRKSTVELSSESEISKVLNVIGTSNAAMSDSTTGKSC